MSKTTKKKEQEKKKKEEIEKADDASITAELDAELAHDLEADGKISHEEVEKADEKREKVLEKKELAPGRVKMKFAQHMYYNDLDKPIFEAGVVYELEGAEWIQRWIKRGGEVLEGDTGLPDSAPANPSELVAKGKEKLDNTPEPTKETPETLDQETMDKDESEEGYF